jgi:glycine dehydrogenase
MSVRDALKRSLPIAACRWIARRAGLPARLQRRQHIRRELPTSARAGAAAVIARCMRLSAEGLAICRTVHRRAVVLAAGLAKLGFAPTSQAFFDTVTVQAGVQNEIVTRQQKDQSAHR